MRDMVSYGGASSHDGTVDNEAGDVVLDTSSCSLTTNYDGAESGDDVLWLHPPSAHCGSGCDVYLGSDGNAGFELSDAELDRINTSGTATLYLGDRQGTHAVAPRTTSDVENIHVDADLAARVGRRQRARDDEPPGARCAQGRHLV